MDASHRTRLWGKDNIYCKVQQHRNQIIFHQNKKRPSYPNWGFVHKGVNSDLHPANAEQPLVIRI